jgi:hypothetical protein
VTQFPCDDDVPLVTNHKWPEVDHRIVLADFLIAESMRLLDRAEALLSVDESLAVLPPGRGRLGPTDGVR